MRLYEFITNESYGSPNNPQSVGKAFGNQGPRKASSYNAFKSMIAKKAKMFSNHDDQTKFIRAANDAAHEAFTFA